MSRKSIVLVLLSLGAVALFLFLSSQAPSTTPVLRVGANPWPGYQPFFWACKQKSVNCANIHMVERSSDSETMRGLRNHALEAGALTLDEAILLASQGIDLRVVAVLDISNGGDVIIGQSDITSMAQLKGRKVGVENTALGAFILSRALELSDMKAEDIHVVPMELGVHESGFAAKNVAAVVTFEPVRTKLVRQGGKILFDSSKIPNEIVDVLVVNTNYIEQYPQRVQELINAYYKASDDIRKGDPQTLEFLATQMSLSPAEVKQAYSGLILPNKLESERLLSDNSEQHLLKSGRKLYNIMLEKQLIFKPVDMEKMFTPVNELYSTP